MANLKDTLVLGKLTVTDSIIAKKLITDGTNDILLADGTTLAQSSLTNSSEMQALSGRVTAIEGAYVPNTGNSTIAGTKTFTGCISSSGGMAFTTGLDENANLPFFLGIESYEDGGTVRYVTANNAKVGYATSAGSATSATTAGSATTADTAAKVTGSYTANGGQQNPNYFGTNKVGFLMMNTPVNNNSQYKDWLIMDCYSGNDVGGGVAFGVNRQSLGAYIMRSASERTSWAETAELALLSTGNTTTNYIPKFTSKNTIGNSSITDNGTTIGFTNKLKQGSPSDHVSVKNMNRFKASLFVEGDDSAPIYPKTPGFYLGRSQSDENRHMDIVTGAQFAYIDFNSHVMAGDPARENTLDYSARFIVDVYTGLTKLTWGNIELPNSEILPNGKIDKRFHIDGNASVAGNLSAVNGLDWNHATWQPQGNIMLTPNGNDTEWSFDIKDNSTSYTNAMWHVWSEKAGSSLLQCIASPSYKVNIPHGNLGLGSANFKYNTSDKCIDVIFN
jgi:hypothetical protein